MRLNLPISLPVRIFMLFLGFSLLAGAGFGGLRTVQELQERSAVVEDSREAPGVVTAIEESMGTYGSARRGIKKLYTAVITYEVDGEAYTVKEGRQPNADKYEVGQEFIVTYSEASPERAYLPSEEFNPLWSLLGAGGIALLSLLFLSVGFARYKAPAVLHG